MPYYPPALTEEQMQDIMDLAGFKYRIIPKPELVQKVIEIPTEYAIYIREISEFESPIPHLFEEFISLKEKGLV